MQSLEGDSYSEGFEGPQRLGDEEKHLLHALQEAESEVSVQAYDCVARLWIYLVETSFLMPVTGSRETGG